MNAIIITLRLTWRLGKIENLWQNANPVSIQGIEFEKICCPYFVFNSKLNLWRNLGSIAFIERDKKSPSNTEENFNTKASVVEIMIWNFILDFKRRIPTDMTTMKTILDVWMWMNAPKVKQAVTKMRCASTKSVLIVVPAKQDTQGMDTRVLVSICRNELFSRKLIS